MERIPSTIRHTKDAETLSRLCHGSAVFHPHGRFSSADNRCSYLNHAASLAIVFHHPARDDQPQPIDSIVHDRDSTSGSFSRLPQQRVWSLIRARGNQHRNPAHHLSPRAPVKGGKVRRYASARLLRSPTANEEKDRNSGANFDIWAGRCPPPRRNSPSFYRRACESHILWLEEHQGMSFCAAFIGISSTSPSLLPSPAL